MNYSPEDKINDHGQCPNCLKPLEEEFGILLCYYCGWNELDGIENCEDE